MDSAALLSVVAAAVVVSIIILTSLCLNCKGNSQPKCITQTYHATSHTSQGFSVVRPYTENHNMPSYNSVNQFIISPSSPDPRRMSACPSSECGSEYVNQQEDRDEAESGYEAPPEKSEDIPEYLDVLPNESHQSQHSLASSANSGQNYENVMEETQPGSDNEDEDYSDSDQYINLQEMEIKNPTPWSRLVPYPLTGRRAGHYTIQPSPGQGAGPSLVGSLRSCNSEEDYVNAPSHEKKTDMRN